MRPFQLRFSMRFCVRALLLCCCYSYTVLVLVACILRRSECVHVTFKLYNRELPCVYASIENRPNSENDVMHLVVCNTRASTLLFIVSLSFSHFAFAYLYIIFCVCGFFVVVVRFDSQFACLKCMESDFVSWAVNEKRLSQSGSYEFLNSHLSIYLHTVYYSQKVYKERRISSHNRHTNFKLLFNYTNSDKKQRTNKHTHIER